MKVKINIVAEVDFYEYNTEKKNQKAKSQIAKWIISILNYEARYITLCIEEDNDGVPIEDTTKKVKYKIE